MKKKDTVLLCGLIIVEFFIIKYFQFHFLPAKYFYDSNKILRMVLYNIRYKDLAYDFTANLFSYFIGFFFSIILFIILLKNKKYSLEQYLFIYSSVALLNIYIFNISKDIIQFIIFLIIYLILKNERFKNKKKVILITSLLLLESVFFRVYYAIMAVMIIAIYYLYNKLLYNKEINKKTVTKIITLSLTIFFSVVFIVSLISNNNYQRIIHARYGVNSLRSNDMDANTMINDLFGRNNTYFTFVFNYIMNAFRLMIPIELLVKGIKYIPFIIYQTYLTILIFKSSKKINKQNVLLLITIISFLIVSIIFEPDFGSFIRHESAMFLMFLELTMINKHNTNDIAFNCLKEDSYETNE